MVNLVDIIPQGKENAVSGAYLSDLLGVSNRLFREQIEKLRNDGTLIASSSTGKKGYYIPVSEYEKEEFLKQYESYIKKMRTTLYNMRGY